MQLIIGNKNYSSWSLRAWLFLKHFQLEFSEQRLALFTDDFYQQINCYGGSGKVPLLLDRGHVIWDSLAICEYLNETYLKGAGWPTDPGLRATARAISCEMHAGFANLRHELPMNCRARQRKVNYSSATANELARIEQIWQSLRQQHADQGPWLFGHFSIADAMFAPVAIRFNNYQVPLSESARTYVDQILAESNVIDWIKAGAQEAEVIPEEEAGT